MILMTKTMTDSTSNEVLEAKLLDFSPLFHAWTYIVNELENFRLWYTPKLNGESSDYSKYTTTKEKLCLMRFY
jgi:hypothetical protein